MIVGICSIELRLAENHDLKGKRRVLKSVKDRVRDQVESVHTELL